MARILVVEDDPSNQIVMRKVLTKIGGHTVTLTEDVSEVLRLVRAREVDLVVMDVSLANSLYDGRHVDGVAITQLLKADAATRDVPVLLSTAYAMRGDAERLQEACGADGYISKPFLEPRELADKVRLLLPASAGRER
jgi:CheY-like chemotaxis protein